MKICLAQFAKSPELGKVKTRLQTLLSAENCLQLHKVLVEHTLRRCVGIGDIPLHLWSTAGGQWIDALCGRYRVAHFLQHGQDLGARLTYAMTNALQQFDAVIFIGSDCPDIDADLIRAVAEALRKPEYDAAIVPASDGGYVLLGVTGYYPELFRGIEWSTERVCEQTLQQAEQSGLRVRIFSALSDIDVPEDLMKHAISREFIAGCVNPLLG